MVTSATQLFRRLIACLSLAVAGALPAQNVLFITDGDSSRLQAIDTTTGSILYSATTSSLAYPIAVRNTVRLGYRVNSGLTGEYNPTSGALIGSLQSPTGTGWDQALDGAASATKNYTFAWPGSSSTPVFQTDPNWANATQIFTISNTNITGITFDSARSVLWFSDYSNVYQYSLTGTLLSQFTHAAGYSGLAYQASTDSLWLVPNSSSTALRQYSTSGTLLQTLTTPSRSGNVYGAEFSAIPEPSTWCLLTLGAGLLSLAARRRR